MKREYLSKEKLDEYFPVTMTFGPFEITLKSFRDIPGHDDSLPYHARVYINGRFAGTVMNDGWGGESVVTPAGEAGRQIIESLNGHLAENKYPFGDVCGFKLHYRDIAVVCDVIAEKCSARTFCRKYASHRLVLYRTDNRSLYTAPFKKVGAKRNFHEVLSADPDFRKEYDAAVKSAVDKGYVVLNADITGK